MDRQYLNCRIEICRRQLSQYNIVWDILRIYTVHTDIRQHRYGYKYCLGHTYTKKKYSLFM